MKPSIYIYFNTPEISRLYAQIVGWVPVERSEGGSHSIQGGLSFGIGPNVGGARESIAQERSEVSVELKLDALRGYLKDQGQLWDHLPNAVAHVLESGKGIFVETEQSFDAPQFRDTKDPVEAVNEVGSLVLECSVGHKNILVSMGLNHMPRVGKGLMGKLGHDAILFRAYDGCAIPLTIFGFLHRAGQEVQVRPIAVGFG